MIPHVLYTHDLEPITVIPLSGWATDYLRKHGRIEFPLYEFPRLSHRMPEEASLIHQFYRVTVTSERLVYRGREHLMLFTHDEELALRLRSDILPGQRRGIQERERQQFLEGFVTALNMVR